jgi:hypothetical protein
LGHEQKRLGGNSEAQRAMARGLFFIERYAL